MLEFPTQDATTGVGTGSCSVPGFESKFEWREEKNLANIRKHGIRFEDATQIFDSDVLFVRAGAGEEVRWKAIELLEGKLITVIFTERAGRTRIISARPSARSERRAYNATRREIQMGTLEPEPPWDESKQIPDEEIDFSDIPETEEWEWKYARRMSHPEAMSKELSDAYDAEWRERNRQKLGLADEAKKP